jgi:hypothetical protein
MRQQQQQAALVAALMPAMVAQQQARGRMAGLRVQLVAAQPLLLLLLQARQVVALLRLGRQGSRWGGCLRVCVQRCRA